MSEVVICVSEVVIPLFRGSQNDYSYKGGSMSEFTPSSETIIKNSCTPQVDFGLKDPLTIHNLVFADGFEGVGRRINVV